MGNSNTTPPNTAVRMIQIECLDRVVIDAQADLMRHISPFKQMPVFELICNSH